MSGVTFGEWLRNSKLSFLLEFEFWLLCLGIFVVLSFFSFGYHKRISALEQTTNQAWSDVEVQLKQRQDIVPKLIVAFEDYTANENVTLKKVVDARQATLNADGVQSTAVAEARLSQALGELFTLADSYPDLAASQNFLQLQDELANTENKISASRRFHNNAVGEYNTIFEQLPEKLVVKLFGFKKREIFETSQLQ